MKIDLILMAAGNSRRFGSNKLLYPWKGKELYRYMLEALLKAAQELERKDGQIQKEGGGEKGVSFRVRVVTQYPEILETVEKLQKDRRFLAGIFSPGSVNGLSYTIRAALAFEEKDPPDSFAFFTADTPELPAGEIVSFLDRFLASGHGAGCMRAGEVYGNPAIFSWKYAPLFKELTGDQGGKKVLNQLLSDCCFYDLPKGCRRDIDRMEDLVSGD